MRELACFLSHVSSEYQISVTHQKQRRLGFDLSSVKTHGKCESRPIDSFENFNPFSLSTHISAQKRKYFSSLTSSSKPFILGCASEGENFQSLILSNMAGEKKIIRTGKSKQYFYKWYLSFFFPCVCLYYTFPPAFKRKLIKRICLAFLLLKGEGCHFCAVLQDRFCKCPSRGNPAQRG